MHAILGVDHATAHSGHCIGRSVQALEQRDMADDYDDKHLLAEEPKSGAYAGCENEAAGADAALCLAPCRVGCVLLKSG